ncbi:MAG: hypothetical protein J6Y20_11585 [Lachnospiraceae bacterium]|nr:hypothetical protein [Lachnospiraceae bacterium]
MLYPCSIVCDGDAIIEISEDGECGIYSEASARESFSGPYNVMPGFEDQTLKTRDKLMLDDVTVNAITVSSVSNPAGGQTVYIGGLIDYAADEI